MLKETFEHISHLALCREIRLKFAYKYYDQDFHHIAEFHLHFRFSFYCLSRIWEVTADVLVFQSLVFNLMCPRQPPPFLLRFFHYQTLF
ncbi:uncharacterized protein DS421_3g75040 [Arachis hypogaea]|nr:uncharacterized protein DS421_3g75040 [Arachis hypogaea]